MSNPQPKLIDTPTTARQLGSIVKSVRDIMRKDKGLSGELDRLPTLSWIMFLKFLDDMEQSREEQALLSSEEFQPTIEPPYRWRDWATRDDCMTGDELISFINDEETVRPDGTQGPGLFAYLRSLRGVEGGRRDVVAAVFRGTVNRMINGHLLREVVNKVDDMHFTSNEEIHTLGHLYESMLKEMRDAAGDSGEFYTPRSVVRFMVEVVNPCLGETVLDPACGTGGFLVEAFRHMEKQCDATQDHEILQQQHIYGGEAKPLPYLLAQMNLLLHGLESPEIDFGNSLRFPLQEIGDEDRVDVVLTNPPFGGEEEKEIQNNVPPDKRTSETALLFLQLIMMKLRRHPRPGRAAVVVPNGPLFATGVASRIKEELLTEFNLHTIIRLPNGVFAPYTGISTNLLFFDRSGPTKEVWYYEHPLPANRKSYTKTKSIQYEELLACRTWWDNREETERAWKVSVEQLLTNGCNLDVKNPHTLNVDHEDSQKLQKAHQELLAKITRSRSVLKNAFTAVFSMDNVGTTDAFLNNFELFTDATEGVQILRELILRLAVSGKLVHQSIEDKLVDDLLETVAYEKERLVNEIRAKKPGPLPSIESESVPFDIPQNWRWVRLGQVARIVGGGTPKTDHSEYYAGEGVPWLTPADLYGLTGKYVGRGRKDISDLGLKKSSAQLIPKGSVLFSSRAPIGYVAIAANPLSTNQGFKSCVPFVTEMNQYLYYFLKYAAREIEQKASGTTFKEVSGREVSLIMVPIPPLGEQRRIVAEADRIMAVCDDLEGELKQSQIVKKKLVEAVAHRAVSTK